MRPTDSTPTPTPREALSHLCWALTHGEDADEDVRVLGAALEQLSGNTGELEALHAEVAALTKQLDAKEAEIQAMISNHFSKPGHNRIRDGSGRCAEDCQACVVDTLRAEVVALRCELAGESVLRAERDAAIDYQNALRGEIHRLQSERDAAESLATALAARVEALETCLLSHSELPTGGPCSYWGKEEQSVLSSTPAADLAAHDDRIRRETVERILAAPTGGEKYILQSPSFGQRDILPLWFYRAAGITEPGHAGEDE